MMIFRSFWDVRLQSIIPIKTSNKSILMKKIILFFMAISFFVILLAQETNTFIFNHIA
ncbi:hypothetical protein GILI108418_06330 [Gillisia limnaea]|uniref:Uncharacterized protein n=1 Tax=Gillisia limnaea (strain DSM 15749 / LMG 21470 / R-8282) TaxID=865937 RepID=H2BSV1_GILLR|nr:hypothetical protein Gilli_0779 [Gillisia limnaea DSM 15749]